MNIKLTTEIKNKPVGRKEFFCRKIPLYRGTATPRPTINKGCKNEMFLRDSAYSLKPNSVIFSLAILNMMNPRNNIKNSTLNVTR